MEKKEKQEEIVLVVNEKDEPVSSAPRSVMRKERLIHRSSYVFIINSAKQLFVQKRVKNKDYLPGYYGLCAGGVMQPGEEPMENAKREAHEEMGIKDVPLTFIQKFQFFNSNIRVWGYIFTVYYDGPIIIQEEEVESFEMWSAEDIKAKVAAGVQITPDTLEAYYLISSLIH